MYINSYKLFLQLQFISSTEVFDMYSCWFLVRLLLYLKFVHQHFNMYSCCYSQCLKSINFIFCLMRIIISGISYSETSVIHVFRNFINLDLIYLLGCNVLLHNVAYVLNVFEEAPDYSILSTPHLIFAYFKF